MTGTRTAGTVFAFILGVGVGALAAILLAPKTGEDLRADISEGVSEVFDDISGTAKDIKRHAQKKATMAKDQLQGAIEVGADAYSKAQKA